MTAGRPSARRSLAVAAFTSALLAIIVAAGGCELAIGDTIPSFYCTNTPGACPQRQVCDTVHGNKCVTSCVIKPSQCVSGEVCASSGLCQPSLGDGGSMPEVSVNEASDQDAGGGPDSTEEEASPPAETGSDTMSNCPGGILCSCGGDPQCNSKLCVDELALGNMAVYQAAGSSNFCSQPCCISADCPAPYVCYATGQGGNYCVDPTWIGRTAGSGTKLGGDTCSLGRDCRSGLCDGTGHCVDTCCSTGQSSSQCAGGAVCTFGLFPGTNANDKNYSAYCGSGGSGQGGSSCSGNMDCESYLCASFVGESGSRCRDACRSASDCTGQYTCSYVLPQIQNPPTPAPVVAACVPAQGNLSLGQTCDPANDMCMGFCDSTSKQCTDVCFTDADCSGVSGWHCRAETLPVNGGGSYAVLCCGT